MKRIWMLGMGVLALALAAGCAGSGEAKRDVEAAVPGLSESKEGMIVAVEDDFIAVQDAENPEAPPMQFRRRAETDLVRNEQPVDWAELSEGMPVRVSFEAEAGAERATRIEVLSGAEADEVRSRTKGSSGWSRPEGITRPRGEGGPPPADMPGVGERNGEMEMPEDDDAGY